MTEQDPAVPGTPGGRGSWPLSPAHVSDDSMAGLLPVDLVDAPGIDPGIDPEIKPGIEPAAVHPGPAFPTSAPVPPVAPEPPVVPAPVAPAPVASVAPAPVASVAPEAVTPPKGPPADHVTPARGISVTASGDASARAAAVTGRRRRLLVASSAAIVVVVAAVAVTWMVQRGNATAAPRPTPNADRTHAIDGPGPATPSASPSTAASGTTSAAPTTTPGAATAAARGPAAPATPRTTSAKAAPAPALAPGGTVRDDFSGTALARRWSLYSSTDSNGGIKSPKQVRVSNGELQILGQGTNASGKGNRSGGMCGCGSGDRLYGVWKVRAKFDAGAGYAQGIGLWPASDDGKSDGHITIGISVEADKTSSWHALIAPGGKSKGGSTSGNFTAWHVYAVEWRASFVRILIDDRAVFDSRSDAPALAIPRTPQHLILQQDIGPQGNIPAPDSDTPGTVIMHVDWMSYSP